MIPWTVQGVSTSIETDVERLQAAKLSGDVRGRSAIRIGSSGSPSYQRPSGLAAFPAPDRLDMPAAEYLASPCGI